MFELEQVVDVTTAAIPELEEEAPTRKETTLQFLGVEQQAASK
jgi:hypothetical protein